MFLTLQITDLVDVIETEVGDNLRIINISFHVKAALVLCKLDVSISSPAPVNTHLKLALAESNMVLNHRLT